MPNSDSHQPDHDAAELLGDVLSEAPIELELLLHYAQEPTSLTESERSQVESYLAESPAHRDRLRVMTRLAELQQQGDLVTALRGDAATGSAQIVPLRRPVERWMALAASVVLLLGLGVFTLIQRPSQRDPTQVVVELPPEPEPVAPLQPDEAPPATQLADTPQQPEPGEMPEPGDEATAVAQLDPASPDPPRSLAPESPAPQSIPADLPGQAPPAMRETIIIAALLASGPINYMAPAGFDDVVRVDGVSRSVAADPVHVSALAPRQLGLTLEPSVAFYWFVSREIDAVQRFVLLAPNGIETLLEVELPAPTAAGIHSIDLGEHGIALSQGRNYRWMVAVSPDPAAPERDAVAGAEVRYVEREPLPATSSRDRAQLLAEAGIWYDALDRISRAIAQHPQESKLWALRAALLESADLREAAAFERRSAPSSEQ